MNRFKLALPAAAIAVIAIVLFVTVPKEQKTVLIGSKQEIKRLSANAFGTLDTLNNSGRQQSGGGGGGAEISNPVYSNDAQMSAPSTEAKIGIGGGGTEGMMPYYPTYYKYIYKGDSFEVEDDQMDVYEREKGFGATAELGSFLEKFNVGLFDINKLQNATIDYIRASENRDQGYAIDMDLKAGTLNINQNWERWPMIDYANPVSIAQVPSDESVIAAANQFLDEYGVSRENYGAPEVQNSWRTMYEKASADMRKSMYVPDMISVVYPAKISGNETYDEGGNKTGMFVYVNARNTKVTSVGEITGQQYSASAYPTEKDTTRLIKILENGGFRNYMPFAADGSASSDPNTKTVEVELGNPKIVYVRMWQTINNQSKDMYVPSLVFPVINSPADFYQQSMTVPLIKEILDSQPDQPIPVPMGKDLPVMTEPAAR